jgi:RNA-directed DNA polymerase
MQQHLGHCQAQIIGQGVALCVEPTQHPVGGRDQLWLPGTAQAGRGLDQRRYVRRKSLRALKDRIRQRTRRTRAVALERIVAELNPLLRGWFGYFQHAPEWTFVRLDGFVRRRLRAWLRKREKRPGFGRCPTDHQRWPNAFFAGLGLFTLAEAHRLARQSR